jgi:hypothetical protein
MKGFIFSMMLGLALVSAPPLMAVPPQTSTQEQVASASGYKILHRGSNVAVTPRGQVVVGMHNPKGVGIRVKGQKSAAGSENAAATLQNGNEQNVFFGITAQSANAAKNGSATQGIVNPQSSLDKDKTNLVLDTSVNSTPFVNGTVPLNK